MELLSEIIIVEAAKIAQSTPKGEDGHGELRPFVAGTMGNCQD